MSLQGKVTLESKATRSLHNIAMQLRKVIVPLRRPANIGMILSCPSVLLRHAL